MSRGARWERTRRQDAAGSFYRNTDIAGCPELLLYGIDGELQQKRVAVLLAGSHITVAQRAFLASLVFVPGHSLLRHHAERLDRIERYAGMVARGRGRTEAEIKEHTRTNAYRYQLMRIAGEERRAANPRPDWMTDPSKLPKRPPGAA